MDEETYSAVFNALRHKVRRDILHFLEDGEHSFKEIMDALHVSSNHLTYHLDNLDGFITKTEHGYKLSETGEAALRITGTVDTLKPMKLSGEDKRRLNVIIVVLSICIIVIAASTVELGIISSGKDERLNALSREAENYTDQFKVYALLDELIQNSTSVILSTGRELSFNMDFFDGSPISLLRYIMVFYVHDDNLTLTVETAINMNEGFYFPLTIQEGDAFRFPDDLVNDTDVTNYTCPLAWDMEVYTRFKTLRIPLDPGCYTLSWLGPVSVDRDHTAELNCSWGSSEMWDNVSDTSVWSYCQLTKDGENVPFIVESGLLHSQSLSMMFPKQLFKGL